jgi:hypothetical protein
VADELRELPLGVLEERVGDRDVLALDLELRRDLLGSVRPRRPSISLRC